MSEFGEDREPNETIIQSYVKTKWFVSTIERYSSAAISPPPRYLETLVWRLNDKGERTDLIHQDEGYKAHAKICELLIKGGEEELFNEEEDL